MRLFKRSRHRRLLCVHVDRSLVVEQADGLVVYVGEFHCSSVFGVAQLHWRLHEPKEGENCYSKILCTGPLNKCRYNETTAVTGYLKVSRIAAHVENKTLRIQLKDASRCVWKVTFRIEADSLL